MKSLKSLEKLIKEIASSEQLMKKIEDIFPVHEFTLTKAAYIKFTQQLRDTGNHELVKYVFDSSDSYREGHTADWSKIQILIQQFEGTDAEISTNQDKKEVYARLAAAAAVIESSAIRLSTKLQTRKEYIYELLSNTEAFRDMSLKFDVGSKVEASSTTAKYTIDLKANVQAPKLPSAFTNKVESLAVDKLSKSILSMFSNVDLSDVTKNFLDSVSAEFVGKKVTRNTLIELNSFAFKTRDIVSQQSKKLVNSIKKDIDRLEAEVKSKISKGTKKEVSIKDTPSAANLLALLNRTLFDAIKSEMSPTTENRLTFGGGFKKSYGIRDIPPSTPGRFAQSVRIVDVSNNTVKYDYQKYPYATFAPGGKQYRFRKKDVQFIIRQAITRIAKTLITERLNIIPI